MAFFILPQDAEPAERAADPHAAHEALNCGAAWPGEAAPLPDAPAR